MVEQGVKANQKTESGELTLVESWPWGLLEVGEQGGKPENVLTGLGVGGGCRREKVLAELWVLLKVGEQVGQAHQRVFCLDQGN